MICKIFFKGYDQQSAGSFQAWLILTDPINSGENLLTRLTRFYLSASQLKIIISKIFLKGTINKRRAFPGLAYFSEPATSK